MLVLLKLHLNWLLLGLILLRTELVPHLLLALPEWSTWLLLLLLLDVRLVEEI